MTIQKLKIKIFGPARDIVGGHELVMELGATRVGELRAHLTTLYPALGELRSLLIAVNQKYAPDDQVLIDSDEIALIPPVSGG